MRKGATSNGNIVMAMTAAGAFVIGMLIVAFARSALNEDTAPVTDVSVQVTVDMSNPGASSPDAAVAEFLDAEQFDDELTSFSLLSAEDRVRYPASEVWNARRAGVLGQVVSWSWVDIDSLQTELLLEPGLSTTRGWQPAIVRLTWETVEDNGWRVSLSQSMVVSDVPSDEGAIEAARLWLTEGQACADDWAPLVPTAVASEPELLEQLCDSAEPAQLASETHPISGRVAATLTQRFGPNPQRWGRAVALHDPPATALVLAPIGDQWVVIDAVSAD